ncbi:MAG: RNA polymerase-associated protein RapA [Luteibacter sp.]|uniref:hypothetical protein n=1 Tax=Luteibacter sp. TaxID=1886636 RepID=UPI001381640B|nr:hypothetical protein [Luteibacter sp.]KAF1004098.1 MAG: RNA polymerase-associated protein RapA [Luteibacter sp.]
MPVRLTDQLFTTTAPRFQADWARQRRTAADILHRLQGQEGIVLADQVGMGKTYVALAVAVSQILATPERSQVVVFVPPAVAEKWIREWKKFSESLLPAGIGIRCVEHPIRSGEAFLKKLDDQPDDRDHLIVLTHTALTMPLKDTFIQLALLHHATRYVRDGSALRERIAKWSTGAKGLFPNPRFTTDHVARLLDTPPSKWRDTWRRMTGEYLPDDPVPASVEEAVRDIPLHELHAAVDALPIRSSIDIEKRLRHARRLLGEATQAVWRWILSSIKLELPLLIVDEAHRLKNPGTQISKLFGSRSDGSDAGVLHGIFRRMLFLTATPFELGHAELIQVLSRMGAVRALAPPTPLSLGERLKDLEKVLTQAQASAIIFDYAWGRLRPEDITVFDTWGPEVAAPHNLSAAAREAWQHAQLAVEARHAMHDALRPWIIRHERPRRRTYRPGAAIAPNWNRVPGGLPIPESAALPFLLAARAQSIALDHKSTRPLFAYGIASSYEAFARLGGGHAENVRDSDSADNDKKNSEASGISTPSTLEAVDWYRKEIDDALVEPSVREAHPKVQATVEKAVALWQAGEKCLIFCWFVRTGEAVEHALSRRLDHLIMELASKALATTSTDDSRRELERIADRLFRRDASPYERIRQRLLEALLEDAGRHEDVLELVVDAAMRHLRTPGYLVRYTHLHIGITDDEVWAGVQGENPYRIVLLDRWRHFAQRLAQARNQIEPVNQDDERDSEFARIRAALLGAHSEDDQAAGRGGSLHAVRRAHGGTRADVRERVIAMFNTPFAPELLVASSVMGEGIDLHQECRFVILPLIYGHLSKRHWPARTALG